MLVMLNSSSSGRDKVVKVVVAVVKIVVVVVVVSSFVTDKTANTKHPLIKHTSRKQQ